MSMLGAQLGDLDDLSGRLTTMGGDVAATRDDALATTTRLIGDVGQATELALQQITTAMERLDASVQTAVSRAESSHWTGANADRFRQAAGEFQGSLLAGQTATREAFTSFKQSTSLMSETLQDFVTGFSGALSDASSAAGDMAIAVNAQRDNLDQVMNQGFAN